MDKDDQQLAEQDQLIEQIVMSDDEPVAKVQKLIRLGLDEEDATDIVSSYQLGQASAVYYEHIPRYGDE